jgi:hypothetical protein
MFYNDVKLRLVPQCKLKTLLKGQGIYKTHHISYFLTQRTCPCAVHHHSPEGYHATIPSITGKTTSLKQMSDPICRQ